MSPTVFREDGYRFFFFSREEEQIHIHVLCADGEAKFWLDPVIALVKHVNLTGKQLKRIQSLIEEHEDEIRARWREHFGG